MTAETSANARDDQLDNLQPPAKKRPTGLRVLTIAAGAAGLAACAPTAVPLPPPPPPPPPPPVVEVIPYRPLPPGGAAYVMNIPQLAGDGRRITINYGLTDDETVWHFRSGWNVAALNCTAPGFGAINEAYTNFVNQHQRALKRVNDRLESYYRRQEGSRRAALLAREKKLTSAYNFFALPPARDRFCNAMLDLSNAALASPPTDPVAFAMSNFAFLEAPFNAFFLDYEQYERDSAAWDARYGAEYGASQPGWVAVQRARAEGNPNVPVIPTSLVADPDTGTSVPVVPVDTRFVSQPVVEPIPEVSPGDGDIAVPAGDTVAEGTPDRR